MKRNLVITLLATLLVASLSAFAMAEQVTLRYFMWDPEFQQMEAELIRGFEAENPNIKVEMTALDPVNFWPRLAAMAAAGELPDVFSMSTGYIDTWARDGLLLNIQHLVDRDLDLDNYFYNVFDEDRFPNKETSDMYAIPYAWVGPVLFYNQDMFDAAGLEYPNDDWTWDDFQEAALALTIQSNPNRAPEQYGFWWYGRYTHVEPWVYANGGRILNENKTRIAIDDKAKEALQFLADLTNVHGASMAHRDMAGIRQQDLFPLQQAAMWVDGSWMIDHVRTVAGDSFRWGIANVPKGPSLEPGEERSYYWPDSVGIAATTKHEDEAWAFVQYLIGANRPVETYMAGKVPIYRAIAYSEEWLQKDQQPGNLELVLALGDTPVRTTFNMGWSEWRGYASTGGAGMNGELDAVTNGQQTVEEAIEKITRDGNAVLERYYPEP